MITTTLSDFRCSLTVRVVECCPLPGKSAGLRWSAHDRLAPDGLVQAQGTCLEPRPGHPPRRSAQRCPDSYGTQAVPLIFGLSNDTTTGLPRAADRPERTLVANKRRHWRIGSDRAR